MSSQPQIRLIGFRLGSDLFVLDLMSVRQIVTYSGSIFVPTAPRFVEGIVLLRSEVVPVIDLHARLRPQGVPSERSLLLISEIGGQLVGLKVDEVHRIVTTGLDAILPAPEMVRGAGRGDVLIGVVEQGAEVLFLLDVESLLTKEEREALQEAHLESVAATSQG